MKMIVGLCCAMLALGNARAEEVSFFKASAAGEEAWSWAGAKVKLREGELQIAEANPAADFGDAFIADRLPYLPNGVITLDVSGVDAGMYTLQVLGFQGDTHASTAEPVKDKSQPGTARIAVADLGFPAGTETILLKMWVAGAEGASTRLRELSYGAVVDTAAAQLDETFADLARWQPDAGQVALAAIPGGAEMKLQPAVPYASAALPVRVERQAGRLLLLHAPAVNGSVTVQLDVFDAAGEYLGAVDVVKGVGAGWHGALLDRAAWPTGAATYSIKLWLGGNEGASAKLARVLVCPL